MADEDAASTENVSAVLRLRGLPFTSTEDDVKEFFADFPLQQIFLCKRNGRSNGEAYVQLETAQVAKDALEALNRKHIGKRYIEIFEAQPSDLLAVKALSAESKAKGFVVRLRGLPYSATSADVVKFFDGLDVVRGADGVLFTFTPDGRPTGEAYVEFESDEAHKEAMKRHKEMIGTRYIELFVSSKVDMYQAMQHNKYVSQTSKKRWMMQGAVMDPTGLRHLTPYATGVDDMTDFFRNFSLAPRPAVPLVPRFGPNPPDGVPGMPGPPVGFVQLDGAEDRMHPGRHKYMHGAASPGRLQSPVPARTQGMPQHHMGVPTYVANYPKGAQGPGGARMPGQQHMQQMMSPVEYQAQQQMMMQQQYMMQQQMMQQQQAAWSGVQAAGMGPPGAGASWYKGYATQGGGPMPGYPGGSGFGAPPGVYGGVSSQGPSSVGADIHHSGSPHSLDVGVADQADNVEANGGSY